MCILLVHIRPGMYPGGVISLCVHVYVLEVAKGRPRKEVSRSLTPREKGGARAGHIFG